ncbi:NUDIX domain-containing protein [Streptomyces roseoverticillatus]|uniref:bifunctional class I SAM-dependent methyltransferase/NUDIX hydrolase n=1 Tax=Streptomyces roseoverticillatus TaxID=66429 RepID=UPI0033FDC211
MDNTSVNEQAWTHYGRHHLDRGTVVPEPERLDWGFWGTGPGDELLGEITGQRVLDIGSGTGRYPAHLARTRRAEVHAVEASATQHQRAVDRYGTTPGLRLVHDNAVEYLRNAPAPVYDAAYSVHGLAYIDPHQLLPALASRVRAGGKLVFSVLHTNSDGAGPADEVAARDEILPLKGGDELPVRMWVLSPSLWEDLLVEAGFLVEDITVLTAPEATSPVACTLIAARRRIEIPPRRVTSRPRSTRPPIANAAFGVGVIVTDTAGRVLLGHHRSGVWECPGGKIDAGESIEEAAVRELQEETTLRAEPGDVQVLALLLDEAGGTNRLTAVALVSSYSGDPVAAEPDLVSRWVWADTEALPDPLFVPSAQALRTWRPELPIDHPPARRISPVSRPAHPAPSGFRAGGDSV